MRIIDPQAAVLTNVEVLAYLSANPPRRPPNPPPNSNPRQWVPSPDLRDHNTVVKEIHNYVSRISPHLLRYPRHTPRPSSSSSTSQAAMTGTMRPGTSATTDQTTSTDIPPPLPSSDLTPMDRALRDLIMKLQPYGLTKAEVVMILNLGVGLTSAAMSGANGTGQDIANGDEAMDVDEEHALNNGINGSGNGEDGVEATEEEEVDWGALALFESVVEEREDRIREEDVPVILGIIRETLNENYGR